MQINILNSKNNSIFISDVDINLKETFECGQCFRWNFENGGYVGIVNGKVLKAIQKDNGFILENTTIEEFEKIWINYFDLKMDYSAIINDYPDDKFLEKAAVFGKGIRILKQNPLEMIISFIISSNNNIGRIKKIIESFCSLYGKPIQYQNNTYYTFPEKEALSAVTEEGLKSIRAGFRDKYIFDAVCRIINGEINFEVLLKLTTDDIKKEFLKIKGVGPKVCDCVLLFGFGRYEAFPKDIWIKRVISEVYGENFDEKSFGKYAGIIQQYLFYFARENPKNLKQER